MPKIILTILTRGDNFPKVVHYDEEAGGVSLSEALEQAFGVGEYAIIATHNYDEKREAYADAYITVRGLNQAKDLELATTIQIYHSFDNAGIELAKDLLRILASGYAPEIETELMDAPASKIYEHIKPSSEPSP